MVVQRTPMRCVKRAVDRCGPWLPGQSLEGAFHGFCARDANRQSYGHLEADPPRITAPNPTDWRGQSGTLAGLRDVDQLRFAFSLAATEVCGHVRR
jgi:hypothetical protein